MRTTVLMIVASVVGIAAQPAWANPEEEVRGVMQAWAQAYTDADHHKLSQLYDRFGIMRSADAVTLIGPEAISEHYYFDAWHNKIQSAKIGDYQCHAYDDATAICTGNMEFAVTKSMGDMWNQPSQFSVALAFDYGGSKWLIHDHRAMRGVAVAVRPVDALQTGAVKPPPAVVPASVVTVPK